MTSPYDPFSKMQLALWKGWMHAMTGSFYAYGRLMEHHAKIVEHHECIRVQDVIPQGADWLDHYGRRNHDVDVEKV